VDWVGFDVSGEHPDWIGVDWIGSAKWTHVTSNSAVNSRGH